MVTCVNESTSTLGHGQSHPDVLAAWRFSGCLLQRGRTGRRLGTQVVYLLRRVLSGAFDGATNASSILHVHGTASSRNMLSYTLPDI